MINHKSLRVKKVKTVDIGQKITSTEANDLALSINQRMDIGAGDASWRLFQDTYNLIRNKNFAAGIGPSAWSALTQTSFLTANDTYAGLNKENPINQFVAGRTGTISTTDNMPEESLRLTNYYGTQSLILTDPSDIELCYSQSAIMQGGYDPVTDDIDSPSLFCPRRNNLFYNIYQDRSVYTSQGGFQSTAEITGQCDEYDIDSNHYVYPDRNLKFTNIKTGVQDIYPSTCYRTVGSYYYSYQEDNVYYVYQRKNAFNPAGDLLIKKYRLTDWVFGPYSGSGGSLGRTSIYPLFESVINQYCKNFRGDNKTWSSASYNLSSSFDAQTFFEKQYLLAPHYGVYDATTGTVERKAVYYRLQPGTYASGSEIICATNGIYRYATHTGFCFPKVFVKTHNVTGSLQFTVFNDTSSIVTKLYSSPPIAASTNAFQYVLPMPKVNVRLGIVLDTDIEVGPAGYIKIYLDELQVKNPDIFDLYYVLRNGSYSDQGVMDQPNEIFPGTDNIGRFLSDYYFNSGSILPYYGVTQLNNTYLGDSSTFDNFRQGPLSYIKFNDTDDIVGYEVEKGNSVVWLRPQVSEFKSLVDTASYYTKNKLEVGVIYQVTGSLNNTGSIRYNNQQYNLGDRFTGSFGFPQPNQITGSPLLWTINNIIPSSSAPTKSYSNEWLCNIQRFPWGPLYTDLSTTDAEGNPIVLGSWNDFYKPWVTNNTSLNFIDRQRTIYDEIRKQGSLDFLYDPNGVPAFNLYGDYYRDINDPNSWMPGTYIVELPSGWSYYKTQNSSINTIGEYTGRYDTTIGDFTFSPDYLGSLLQYYCQSNIIYKPPLEVLSVDTDATMNLGGVLVPNLWKITFNGRMHHNEDAASAIAMKNIQNWNNAPQVYRTDENAIMDFLIYQYFNLDTAPVYYNPLVDTNTDGNFSGKKLTRKVGEFTKNPLTSTSDFTFWTAPFGSLASKLCFTKKIPWVYEDNNDISQLASDTRCEVDWMQMIEYYIKIICEGYVSDSLNLQKVMEYYNKGILQYADINSPLAEYNYIKLLYQTTGKCIPIATMNKQGNIKAYGHGPEPGCYMIADQYNQLAKMVNALDKFILMLPYEFAIGYQYNEVVTTSGEANNDTIGNTTQGWSHNGSVIVFTTGNPAIDYSNYGDTSQLESDVLVGPMRAGSVTEDRTKTVYNDLGYISNTRAFSYRIDPNYVYAIPYDLGDLTDRLKLFAIDTTTANWFESYWSAAQKGVDCYNGQPAFEHTWTDPADTPCQISMADPNNIGSFLYLHGTNVSSSVVASYECPASMVISLVGTGSGDWVEIGNNQNGMTVWEYAIKRNIKLIEGGMVIQLQEYD